MRVTFNTSFRESNEAIARNAADLAARQREVSSGKRVQVPSDNPTATTGIIAEKSAMATTEQYKQAADSVSSRLSVVDTALSELINQVSAAKVAAMSAGGSTTSPTQREGAANQLEGIKDAMLSTINTQFRGTFLFSGNESTTRPYDKVGTTISTYQGGSATTELDIDHQTSVRVNVVGDAIMQGAEASDIFTVLDDLVTAARAGDSAGLQAGMDALDLAADRISIEQTHVGTDLANIDTHAQQLEARRLGNFSRLSSLEDANMAESISAMSRAETAYRAALGAIGTTQQLSLLDYLK